MALYERKHEAISIHPTLDSENPIKVNWEKDYDYSFCCPSCSAKKVRFYRHPEVLCKVAVHCLSCKKQTLLTCPIPQYIYSFQPELSCPNPLCDKLGPDNKTIGWCYKRSEKTSLYQCRFCKVHFTLSTHPRSWMGRQEKQALTSFNIEEDIWDLRHFYEISQVKNIHFETIQPRWYCREVKNYIHYLLLARSYSSADGLYMVVRTLRQFGLLVQKQRFKQTTDINREIVLSFLDQNRSLNPRTIHNKLCQLKPFFNWLELPDDQLIRSADFPKTHQSDPDWLDETVRKAISSYLHKIPKPIARHYQLQEYTAARPFDVCHLPFDCLEEEEGKWFIRFYQQKVGRQHQLPASRAIRKIIEEQQHWIRQTIGQDYPYLFCYFRSIRITSYPKFPGMKPLPEPSPVAVSQNPMVKVIRAMIERENIRDSNGKRPHFVGKITRASRLQEVRTKHGIEAAQLYADHIRSSTTLQHYAPPTVEQIAAVDLPFQSLLINPENRFLAWQSLPESLLQNPDAHELDTEISPRLVVYGYCILDPKIPCPYNLYPKCYGCSDFCSSTTKLPLYERQYAGEHHRMKEAEVVGAELAYEEAKTTIEAMDNWLPDLRRLANVKET